MILLFHRLVFLILFCMWSIGCSSIQDKKQPYDYSFSEQNKTIVLEENKVAPSPASPVIEQEIKVVTYTTPNLTQREVEKQPKSVTENNIKFTITPTTEHFISGAAVTYNYIPNHMYQIFCAVDQVTNLILESGEQLTSEPICADDKRFVTALVHSGNGNNRVQHVLISPLITGKETILIVNTNKRFYTFQITSFKETFMPIVNFNYPLDKMKKIQAMQSENNTFTNANAPIPVGDFSNLDFNYRILPISINKPSWMPSIVFNDGLKTYINFASAFRAAQAPVLFAVNEKKERYIVNYRVSGTYYIVDQILTHAELLVDANAGNVIVIKHSTVK